MVPTPLSPFLKEAQVNAMPAFAHEVNTKYINKDEMFAFGTEARLDREKKCFKRTATLYVRSFPNPRLLVVIALRN